MFTDGSCISCLMVLSTISLLVDFRIKDDISEQTSNALLMAGQDLVASCTASCSECP